MPESIKGSIQTEFFIHINTLFYKWNQFWNVASSILYPILSAKERKCGNKWSSSAFETILVSDEIIYMFLKISMKPRIVHSSSLAIKHVRVLAKSLSCILKAVFSLYFSFWTNFFLYFHNIIKPTVKGYTNLKNQYNIIKSDLNFKKRKWDFGYF